jgi:signal transduction histidine kinase
MKLGHSKLSTGHDAKSWPVLLLLLAVVLVPTVGVLWFMSQAMRNEGLAVRQKLNDVYQVQLLGLQQELQRYWQARSAELDEREPTAHDPGLPASRVFAERVRGGLADSVVVYDSTGRPAYPAPPRGREADRRRSNDSRLSGSWRRAERLEHSGQSVAAAARYAAIAARATGSDLAARALQAQARCLVQADQTQAAIRVLIDELSRPEYDVAIDSHGRLIVPSAQLLALQLIGGGTDPTFQRTAVALAERLTDYDDPALPAAQRTFLMTRLKKHLDALAPGPPGLVAAPWAFEMLPAEQLAQRYLESDPPAPSTTSVQPSGLPEVWHLASPSGTVVALFHQRRLVADLESLIAAQRLTEGARVELLPPGVELEDLPKDLPKDLFAVSLPASGFLRGWQLVLRPEDQTLFATAANQRINAYLLTGVLVVVLILILAVLVGRAIARQRRLTRLKNDLLATVSHELKTPLASMRLLVDTLLETGIHDSQRVLEYLRLIARENVRLSRLVDNFLTFSRMEQSRQGFEKEPIQAETVVEAAAASVADRFSASGCLFEVKIAPKLPTLVADHDALVTVLLNLLDNAYKYSKEERHIVLRGYRENGQVCFAVGDNGIGLDRRMAGKIFDRFYQVDQSLSRDGSGCGLGLSIVKLIVSAHGGSVDVDSRPGEGSTFTVRLPPGSH